MSLTSLDTSLPITLGGTVVPSGGAAAESSSIDVTSSGYDPTVGVTVPQNYVETSAPQGLNEVPTDVPGDPWTLANAINYVTGQPADHTGQETASQAVSDYVQTKENDPNSFLSQFKSGLTQVEVILAALAIVVVVGAVLWYVPKSKPAATGA